MIFTKSMNSETVPEDWRIANVMPIFKNWFKREPGELPTCFSYVDPMQNHGRSDLRQHYRTSELDCRQRTVLNGIFSDWCKVLSGVPQGCVLGPLEFIIFINNLEECTNLVAIMNKFADDTKVGHGVLLSEGDKDVLQDCVNKLLDWADKWDMQSNMGKCKTLHLCRGNLNFNYFMHGVALDTVQQERDIGVFVPCSLRPSAQCAEAVRRAMVVLGTDNPYLYL